MSEKSKLKRDPYVRMLLAAQAGRGVRLSADEVHALTVQDDMIGMAAEAKLEIAGLAAYEGHIEVAPEPERPKAEPMAKHFPARHNT